MSVTYEYTDNPGRGHGGIGFRLDIHIDAGTPQGRHVAYTTNPDGSGLFFHDGRGGRRQTHGNGQFSAMTLRQFKARTARILRTYTDPESLYEPLDEETRP